jgi:hypothetical protein
LWRTVFACLHLAGIAGTHYKWVLAIPAKVPHNGPMPQHIKT